MNISTAVVARLIGYAVIIVRNVMFCDKTSCIQAIRTPHTPIIVRIAGTSENPNPRRYPDITSYSILNVYAVNIIVSLVYPISTTSGSLLNIESRNIPDNKTSVTAAAVAIASSTCTAVGSCGSALSALRRNSDQQTSCTPG